MTWCPRHRVRPFGHQVVCLTEPGTPVSYEVWTAVACSSGHPECDSVPPAIAHCPVPGSWVTRHAWSSSLQRHGPPASLRTLPSQGPSLLLAPKRLCPPVPEPVFGIGAWVQILREQLAQPLRGGLPCPGPKNLLQKPPAPGHVQPLLSDPEAARGQLFQKLPPSWSPFSSWVRTHRAAQAPPSIPPCHSHI